MTTADSSPVEKLIRRTLIACIDDWVDMAEFEYYALSAAGRADGVTADAAWIARAVEVGMAALRILFTDGLVVPGHVRDGFIPWQGDPPLWITVIEGRWAERQSTLMIGELCWLATTEAGEAKAMSLETS